MLSVILVNFITILRIVGVIAIFPLYYSAGVFETGVLIAVCYFTDYIDGFLARRLKASTMFGSLLDTIADKLLNIVCFLVLFQITKLAIIPVIMELIIILVNYIRYKNGQKVEANIYGKIKMNVLAILIIFIFLCSENYEINYIQVFIPVILMEIIVIFSYVMDYLENPKNQKKSKLKKYTLKEMLDPKYLMKYKEEK